MSPEEAVSIPFSSGQALQSPTTEPLERSVWSCFNSLFIGIGSAILLVRVNLVHGEGFQFPFHRDRLCNIITFIYFIHVFTIVSIPFSSGQALQYIDIKNLIEKKPYSFNSLFIGIGSAISQNWIPCSPDRLSFNSLFIGIGSAMLCIRSQIKSLIFVSIPFSSGQALQ